MSGARWFKVGLAGSIVTAVCCFTPLLAVSLGALGLAGWIAGLDVILLPALALSLAALAYGWYQSQRESEEK